MATIKLANVRLAYAESKHSSIWRAVADENGNEAYGATFILQADDEQKAKVEAAMKAAAKDKWDDKAPAVYKQLAASGKLCLRNGEEKEGVAGFGEGTLFINARSKVKPTLLNGKKEPTTKEDGVLYSGAYVNVIFEIYAQDNKFGKRVNAQLKGIMFSKKGEALGGGGTAAAQNDFDDFADGEDNGAEDDGAF